MLTHGCDNNFDPVSTCTGPTLVPSLPILCQFLGCYVN